MRFFNYFTKTLLVAICYFSLGEVGLLFAIPPGYASAIFPASAFAVVVSLQIGIKGLPGIWLGSLALNMFISWQNNTIGIQGYAIAASIGMGAVAQAWLAKNLVQFRIKDAWKRLDHDGDIVTFLFLTGPVSCLVSSGWAMLTLVFAKIINLDELTFIWWNWWTGDTLGVLLFAPILLNLIFRHQLHWQSRLRIVVLPTLILAVIIFAIYFFASEKENRMLKYRLEGHGQAILSTINQELLAYTETIGALASLLTINPKITRSDFEVFVQPIFQRHDDINALSWNPVVKNVERQAFETQFGLEYNQNVFNIYERDTQGNLKAADTREWYVPVGYIFPFKSNQKALGYDIASNDERLTAILDAIKIRKIFATPPIQLVQDNNKHTGLLLVQPVYTKNKNYSGMPIGFAVGVFKIEEMLTHLIDKNLPEQLGLVLKDLNAETDKSIIYSAHVKETNERSSFNWSRIISFAGRQWQLTIYPSAEFLTKERSLFAWSILATGIIIASLLQAMLLGISGRTFAIKRRVDEQTQEIIEQSQKLQNHQKYLAREKDKYETLLHASGDGIYILDIHSQAVEVNQKFCDMLGYRHDEVIGMHVTKWCTMQDIGQIMMHIQDNYDETNLFETVHLRKDGSHIDVEISAKLLIINSQQFLWNASRDISERKRMQLALTQAKEAAEQATELKSRFLANMSHEVRTPMNGIIGLSELALNLPSTPEVHDYIQKIATSSYSLLGILNDILDFSKIEAHKVALEKKSFNLMQVIDNIRNLFEHHAKAKQLDFNIDLDNKIPDFLIGDNLRLQQIISNLIGNSIKFTNKGSVSLFVQLINLHDAQTSILFKVLDTGVGISAEQQSRLFKAFSQGDDSITRRFGGAGLGLAISESLLKLMGSEFIVNSEPDNGCCISFIVNFQIPEHHETINDEYLNKFEVGGLKKKLQQKANLIGGSQILVVEDNRINQFVVKGFLTLASVKVCLANNGEEALEKIKSQTFDAILMDVQMPVMDGLEATRQIRKYQQFQTLPIIALTAGVTKEERESCLLSGMNDLVSKPVNSNELIAVLCRWI